MTDRPFLLILGLMTSVEVLQGDITELDVDAIINAANARLVPGGGVDGAIHRAGGPSIAVETAVIAAAEGFLKTGEAVITGAGLMPTRYVIHTVGPIWGEVDPENAVELLGRCYRSCLDLARNQNLVSVAFPNISTGVYGFPKLLAGETAVAATRSWVQANPDELARIVFVCFDSENLEIYRRLLG